MPSRRYTPEEIFQSLVAILLTPAVTMAITGAHFESPARITFHVSPIACRKLSLSLTGKRLGDTGSPDEQYDGGFNIAWTFRLINFSTLLEHAAGFAAFDGCCCVNLSFRRLLKTHLPD